MAAEEEADKENTEKTRLCRRSFMAPRKRRRKHQSKGRHQQQPKAPQLPIPKEDEVRPAYSWIVAALAWFWRLVASHPFQVVLAMLMGVLTVGGPLKTLMFIEPSIEPSYADTLDPTPVHMNVWNGNDVGLSEVRIECRVDWMRVDDPKTGLKAEMGEMEEFASAPGLRMFIGDPQGPHVVRHLVPDYLEAVGYLQPHGEPQDLDCGLTIERIDEIILRVDITYQVKVLPLLKLSRSRMRYYKAARNAEGKLRWLPARPFGDSSGKIPLAYPSMHPWDVTPEPTPDAYRR